MVNRRIITSLSLLEDTLIGARRETNGEARPPRPMKICDVEQQPVQSESGGSGKEQTQLAVSKRRDLMRPHTSDERTATWLVITSSNAFARMFSVVLTLSSGWKVRECSI